VSKRKLNPLKLEKPEKFENFLRVLWDEICWAYFYYDMLNEAQQLCKQHEEDFKFSPYFWHYTLQAYYETALIRLHRIYDQNQQSFNLHRFLITVRDNKQIFDSMEVRKRRATDPHADELIRGIGPFDLSQLDRDIEFSSEANPKVANLKHWRDRVTFHKDERERIVQTKTI
jgi:AbiU2